LNLITRFAPHFLRKLELYPETIIIAASQSGLDVLVTYGQKIFFIDGTHSLLEGKMQLTEIAIKDKFGCGVPCAYMISKEKTSTVYKLFIETINNITHGQWRPEYCKCDFERALHLGITEALPGCIVFGCFFHLMQAIVRQIKKDPQARQHEKAIVSTVQKLYFSNTEENYNNTLKDLLQQVSNISSSLELYLKKTWFGSNASCFLITVFVSIS